jgi:predicted Zn-dependent protease with MMP-like domain
LQWGQRLSYSRSMSTRQTLAPLLADIEALAQAAVERLPDLFRDHLASVLLRIEDFPDAEVIAEMELESEWEILGLYQGRHVGLKGDEPTGALPDMIFLYRRPILDEWCQTDDSLEAIVTHVLVHEVGHHFGLSDEDIDAIEAGVA